MNDINKPLSPLQRAALVIEKMQTKLDALEYAKNEPIAIIGLSCRFPGNAHDVQAFWQLLHEGVDAVTEVPPGRWNTDDLKIDTSSGGFLQQIDLFDPQFFGISPREAVSMDPQHRLLLEVSWEALENAGQTRERLAGTRSGVFVGITMNEYSRQFDLSDSNKLDVYYITGNVLNAAAGRLSYILGLQGPSMAIDTACSSSLVAVHQACQSLRNGDCDLALTGGVNLILSPITMFALSQANMLAADGRCKTFDAAADGLGRGEGCGIIVLKRFSDARADGDNILALIRGSAVNQDGASSGLTVPNGVAQQHLIRQALENAKVAPSEVDYVEAHGTGTALGDPIEVGALASVLGEGRLPSQPVMLGSVKTNVGHLEAASGVTGLIKLVLALQHEEIPPHLHFKQPNPHIAWDELPLKVLTEPTPWASGKKRRIAGVSSFGLSGTNAHMVLEEAPKTEQASANSVERPLHLLTLSAKSAAALKQLAARYEKHIAAHPTLAWADICFSANTGRSHFNHRLGVVASSVAQARDKLTAFIEGQTAGVFQNTVTPQRHKIAFLFTGQGSQYIDMGRQLYETQPTFRQTLERCDEILRPYLEKPLLSVIGEQEINETAYTQPALFALEYALAKLWQSWGIEPDVVMGHSVGEYVAACIAGVFSLEDGLKLIAARGHLMQTLCDKGDMLVLSVDETKAAEIIQPYAQDVSIAAINGPENVVISGKHEAIESIRAALSTEKDLKTKLLPVSHAFHSPMMAPMLAEFERVAAELTYTTPQIPLCSNVTGQMAREEIATPAYWCRHVRQPVRFAASMETLYQQGYEIFLEIGPKSSLLSMARQCLPEGTWLMSLRQGQEDWQPLLQSLAELYVRGVPVDWSCFDQDYQRRRINLPTYPFQRQRFWVDTEVQKKASFLKKVGFSHPLLGQQLYSAALKNGEIQFESQISQEVPAFLKHHCIHQAVVLPAAAYLEMALAAGASVFKSEHLVLEEIIIQQALILPADAYKTLQLILTPDETGKYSFQICSLTTDEAPFWTTHISGKVESQKTKASKIDLTALQADITEEISVSDLYQHFQDWQMDYGPSFQCVQRVWRNEKEVLGQIRLPETLVLEAENYKLHPALLDASVQIIGAVLDIGNNNACMPVGLKRLTIFARPSTLLWSHAKIHPINELNQETFTTDVRLFRPSGQIIAIVEGYLFKQASREALLDSTTQKNLKNWLYEIVWREQALLPKEYLSTPQEIRDNVVSQLTQLGTQPDLAVYEKVLEQLEVLSVAYVVSAFQQMGWTFSLKQRFSTASIAAQLAVISQHQRLLSRLLEILSEVGILREIGEQWEVVVIPERPEPQVQNSTLLAQYPIAEAELTLLEGCGSKLAQVLQGACDPLQLLFPYGNLTTVSKVYQDSPGAQLMNSIVQKAVSTALAGLPQGREVRILEIGAGTGGTTAAILPHLDTHKTKYVFTDVSPLFISQAQEKFKLYPFVRYQLLNIEQAPESQGFSLHQFDLIVAANVLHATSDLRQTLHHVQQLLVSGGILVLFEGTARSRWIDLIFGLTEGWWKFADHDLRPAYPLLSAFQWQAVLEQSGFQATTTISPEQAQFGNLSQQSVIVAQSATLKSKNIPTESISWLILADAQGMGEQLAALLRARGDICILVFPGETYEQLAEQSFKINPTSSNDFYKLLNQLDIDSCRLHSVVHLWSLDSVITDNLKIEDLEVAANIGCSSVLHLVQSFVKIGFPKKPPSLWLVTRSSQAVGLESTPPAIAQSPVWGMGRVVALEYPELWGGMIDLAPHAEEDEATMLLSEIWHCSAAEEDHIAFRDKQRYVARLVHSKPQPFQKIQFHSDSTYLITGGLGFLGLRLANWMVAQGAQHLVLIGRREFPKRETWANIHQNTETWKQIQTIQLLEERGASVIVLQADVSNLAQMSGVFEQIKMSQFPLRGIIHAAGVPGYQAIPALTLNALQAVFSPKITGTWLLHQLTKEMDLDFFVCFSSASAVWGSKGQAHYGAANHFIDILAHYRRTIGLPALSINWGLLEGGGMASNEEYHQWLVQTGVEGLQPEQGFRALAYLVGSKAIQSTVAKVTWRTFKALYEARRQRPLLEEIDVQPQVAPSGQRTADILQRLKEVSTSEHNTLLTGYLQEQVAKALQLSPSLLDVQNPLNNMGVDSLMAMELRNRIQTDLSVDVPLVKFMEGFSVATLATLVSEQLDKSLGTSVTQEAGESKEVVPLELNKIDHLKENAGESSYPLSYGQQGLWFLHQFAPESTAYHIAFSARICSPVDIPALRRAFQALIMRHPMLRTTFTKTSEGQPVQEVHRYQAVDFEEINASSWTWEELKNKVFATYQRPFDLERGPVMRVSLFSRSEQDHVLLLTLHQIVSDYWSLLVLIDELRVLYPAEKAGAKASLAPLNLSYINYIRWQADMLASPVGEKLWTYWQKQFAAGLPVLNLPTARPRPAVPTFRGASLIFEVSEELTQRIEKFTQAEGATLFTMLLAAFQVLLYRYTDQEDILVGSIAQGRHQPEFAGIVGDFVNTLLLRATLTPELTFRAFLSQVRQTLLAANEHQDYPLSLLLKQLEANSGAKRPLEIGFVLHLQNVVPQFEVFKELFFPGETKVRVNFGDIELAPFEIVQQVGQFDLSLEIMEKKTSLFAIFNYNPDLFDESTISRMKGDFETLLEGIVSNSEQCVSELPMLTET